MYFVEKTKGMNLFKQFDYILFFAVLLLSAIGMLVLKSATNVMPGGSRIIFTQAVGLVIGIIFALVISSIDYKDFKNLGILLYLTGVVLLVLVLLFGVEKQGAKSWFDLPVAGSFQPSELAKIAFIVFASVFFERIKEGQKDMQRNILKLGVYFVIPLALVLKQPDAGTGMVFMFVFTVMVFICGIHYKYIIIAISTFIASTPVLWFFILKPHQKDRIYAFLDPENPEYARTIAWNVNKSRMAIGSGQLYGKGLFKGIQTQSVSGGVPVKESDFIFSVVGEELGFIGAIVIVVLIMFILLRCIYIAKNSRDTYGSFLVIGLTAMLAFHFIENIGMSIGLLPVTGIPLPFVSQGGTAMITNYIAIGIILSVSMRRKKVIFNNAS